MKPLKCILLFAILIGVNTPMAALADGPVPQTQFAYDRKDFCATEAKIRFENLNEMTKDDVEKIKKIKQNINDLEARKKIIEDLKNIRNDYIHSMQEISADDNNIKQTIKIETVEKFKSLLRDALTLNAITLLTKNNATTKVSPNIESLCENDPTNKDLAICNRYNPNELLWISKSKRTEINTLNYTLENFSNAMDNVHDKAALNGEIENIYKSIPKKIDPDAVLEVLANKAPDMKELLLNAHTKDEVEKCLNDNSKSCESLIANPEIRKNLNPLLGQESKNISDILGNLLSQVKNELPGQESEKENAALKNQYGQIRSKISEKYSADLNLLLSQYDSPRNNLLDESDEKKKAFINSKTEEVLAYSDKLFKKFHPNAKPNEIPNAFTAINFSNDEYKHFKNKCLIDEEVKGHALINQINECGSSVKGLMAKIEDGSKSINELTDKLKKELHELIDNNPKLARIEKLKQYIAQRYLRSCPEAQGSNTLVSNVMTISCEKANTSISNSSLDDLTKSYTNILGKLQSENKVGKTKGELGAFSKTEINLYTEYCKEPNPDPTILDTCNDVVAEHNRLAQVKDSEEWSKFGDKYWVQYNARNSKGYDVIEKKSNFRILGEGIGQSSGRFLPMWMGNYQLETQIDMMTNQALFTKQLNYMNDPYSPWMMNSPYFQTYFYGMASPFTGFGTAPMGSNGGFNFN